MDDDDMDMGEERSTFTDEPDETPATASVKAPKAKMPSVAKSRPLERGPRIAKGIVKGPGEGRRHKR